MLDSGFNGYYIRLFFFDIYFVVFDFYDKKIYKIKFKLFKFVNMIFLFSIIIIKYI